MGICFGFAQRVLQALPVTTRRNTIEKKKTEAQLQKWILARCKRKF
jgi:hypothetical protein